MARITKEGEEQEEIVVVPQEQPIPVSPSPEHPAVPVEEPAPVEPGRDPNKDVPV